MNRFSLSRMARAFKKGGGAAGLVKRTLAANGIGAPLAATTTTRARGAERARPAKPGMSRHSTATRDGGRSWQLYRPEKPAEVPVIVLMLHGCTQSGTDFAAGTNMNAVAGKRGWHVVWPDQQGEANPMKCWNWFDPRHQDAKGGEPAILAAILRDARAEIGAPKAKVVVAGLSAGAAMAAVLAQAMPREIVAVGLHSGLPPGAASNTQGALAAMRNGAASTEPLKVPAIIFHGLADKTVVPANGEALGAHIAGKTSRGSTGGRRWTLRQGPQGEFWQVEGLGHAWSGGRKEGTYTDPAGPDASAEMARFFASRLG